MSNLSFVRHTGDGKTRSFTLAVAGENIGYFRTSDIHGYVDDVEVPITINPSSPHIVTFTDAPKLGADILIRRQMPVKKTYADFARGNNFGHRQVNNTFVQQLYLTQEILDGFFPKGFYFKNDIDMGGHRLCNVGDAKLPHDAVTKYITDGLDHRINMLEQSVSTNSRFLPWQYNAAGGEKTLEPPYNFSSARLFINGVRQRAGAMGSYYVDNKIIRLAEPLEEGDWVDVELGTEPLDVGDAGIVSLDVNNLYTVRKAIPWSAGITVRNPLQLYTHNGINYLPKGDNVPFVTGQSWSGDFSSGLFHSITDQEIIGEAKGTSDAMIVESNHLLGHVFKVKMSKNSNFGMTLNGLPIKVKDIYATEQSMWTITTSNLATNSKPKQVIWRPCYQNLLSSDVIYDFIKHEGFYEVIVPHIYKHMFVPCGVGKDITELQDALCFVSQFTRGTALDPIFMNVIAGTNYYPNKAQISITVPKGISVMHKAIRMGENNMNGIEIIHEDRYVTGDYNPDDCVVDFSSVRLGRDDLACINVWKTDFGEIHGIRFKFHGEFNYNNQAFIRYQRSEGRFKKCKIDLSGAKFINPTNLTGVAALVIDRQLESYFCEIIAPADTSSNNPLVAFNMRDCGYSGNWKITGHVRVLALVEGNIRFDGINLASSTWLLGNAGIANVSFSGTGSILNTGSLRWEKLKTQPLDLYIASNIKVSTSLERFKDQYTHFSFESVFEGQRFVLIDEQGTPHRPVILFGEGTNFAGLVGKYENRPNLQFGANGTNVDWEIDGYGQGHFIPSKDNAKDIGYDSKRPKTVYSHTTNTHKIIMRSPNGTRFNITVNDEGALTVSRTMTIH